VRDARHLDHRNSRVAIFDRDRSRTSAVRQLNMAASSGHFIASARPQSDRGNPQAAPGIIMSTPRPN